MSKKIEPPEEDGCPLWMVSFGDAMSLLVTFFVMLISFAEFEDAKLLELMGALKGGLRANPTFSVHLGTSSTSKQLAKQVGKSEGLKMIPKGELSKMGIQELSPQKRFASATIGSFDKGYILRLLDEGLSFIVQSESVFEPGTSRLLPNKESVLGIVADIASSIDNEIRINGVTPEDMVVRSSKVTTPWGLAAERAIALKDEMCTSMDFKPDRFSIGARVEGEGDTLITRYEQYPPDRMEIIVIGLRDKALLDPEEVIIQDRWF